MKSSSCCKGEQVVGVELGLKMEENNTHVGYNGGSTLNEYKYNNNNITMLCDNSNNNNNNNIASTTTKSRNNVVVGGVRSLHPFDLSSYYYPSGGMATAAMGGFPFTAAQWKELERQAMIYKYMMASLPVPPDLLYSSFTTNFSPSTAFSPASYFMGTYGYGSGVSVRWSGNSKDADPGRCKRTDGKKWRCSRDVAPDSKYCERHMHRGRPRSRKHVEQQLPINNNSSCSNKGSDHLTKKTRLNDQKSVGSCIVQPPKAPIFEQPMVSNAIPFEDSRNLAWSNEQQWQHLMQSNMNSSVFQHQLEVKPLNLNSNGGLSNDADLTLLEKPLFDAWSMGASETKDNDGNSHNQNLNEEMCQIHMGLGHIDSWVASTTTTPGGPLAEVLRPAMSDVGEGDFVTPPATAVSSPSGVLQKTLATFSDSSGSNSPVCHNSNISSDMPFNWLN